MVILRSFSMSRACAIFSKEFKHILRDPFTMFIALLLPLIIVLILGNSIEFNVKSISLAYVDNDHTVASRKLVETFGSSGYFKPYMLTNPDDGFDEIITERARAVLVIPPNFQRDINSGDNARAQIILDGADNTAMMAVSMYLTAVNINSYFKIFDLPRYVVEDRFSFKTRYLFNPELNSRWFAVPGLAAAIIALVAIMLTTLTVCREWERGSMEMLLSTPATPMEIIFGKGLPYAVLSFIGFIFVFIIARTVFGVPFMGNYFTLGLGTILFILGYLGIGLLISVSTHRQEVAIQFAIIIGLLPTVVLSGFIFPVEYMSRPYQIVSSVMPARFYMDLTRDQFLKGSSLVNMMPDLAFLGLIAVLLLVACAIKFRRTLE
ncbi:MAG: ABC transporter permease [Alphaproteobacteria bacterium]|nr:ABC transporter permease [Alphaproteobacteria bacterium]